jgi:hypothetical protein
MLDIWNNNAFGIVSMTQAVNELPYTPGRIGMMGLFEETPVATTSIAIENIRGTLTLVDPTPRGGVGQAFKADKAAVRRLEAVHLQLDGTVMADEVQGVREFGSSNNLKTVQGVVNNKFAGMFRNLDATMEHLYLGAIKGKVVESDGTTVIWDLFKEFDVTPLSDMDFVLGTATTNIHEKCMQVVRGMQDRLGGAPLPGVVALCGDTFFDKFSTHAKTTEAYDSQQQALALSGASLAYSSFRYGGITWENYRGSVNGTPFIAADECRFFPVGVPGLFRTFFAPADWNETVNTLGLPRYAKLKARQDDKGADLWAQSNPITLCTIPAVLRRGFSSN